MIEVEFNAYLAFDMEDGPKTVVLTYNDITGLKDFLMQTDIIIIGNELMRIPKDTNINANYKVGIIRELSL